MKVVLLALPFALTVSAGTALASSPCETAARAVELARDANLPLQEFEQLRELECGSSERAQRHRNRNRDRDAERERAERERRQREADQAAQRAGGNRGRGRPADANASQTGSPACRTMIVLNQMAGISTGLTSPHKRLISAERLRTCRSDSATLARKWSNRRILKSNNGAVFYPNGQMAVQPSERSVKFPNGRVAARANGQIHYPNGRVAKDNRGRWFTPTGQRIAGGWTEIRNKACSQMSSKRNCEHLYDLYARVGSGRDRDLVVMASSWRLR